MAVGFAKRLRCGSGGADVFAAGFSGRGVGRMLEALAVHGSGLASPVAEASPVLPVPPHRLSFLSFPLHLLRPKKFQGSRGPVMSIFPRAFQVLWLPIRCHWLLPGPPQPEVSHRSILAKISCSLQMYPWGPPSTLGQRGGRLMRLSSSNSPAQ